MVRLLGYSFGDSHINLELESALRRSNGNLVLNIFTCIDSPELDEGALGRWAKAPELREKVHIYANRGYFHPSGNVQSEIDLSWWKFEVLTELLGGAR